MKLHRSMFGEKRLVFAFQPDFESNPGEAVRASKDANRAAKEKQEQRKTREQMAYGLDSGGRLPLEQVKNVEDRLVIAEQRFKLEVDKIINKVRNAPDEKERAKWDKALMNARSRYADLQKQTDIAVVAEQLGVYIREMEGAQEPVQLEAKRGSKPYEAPARNRLKPRTKTEKELPRASDTEMVLEQQKAQAEYTELMNANTPFAQRVEWVKDLNANLASNGMKAFVIRDSLIMRRIPGTKMTVSNAAKTTVSSTVTSAPTSSPIFLDKTPDAVLPFDQIAKFRYENGDAVFVTNMANIQKFPAGMSYEYTTADTEYPFRFNQTTAVWEWSDNGRALEPILPSSTNGVTDARLQDILTKLAVINNQGVIAPEVTVTSTLDPSQYLPDPNARPGMKDGGMRPGQLPPEAPASVVAKPAQAPTVRTPPTRERVEVDLRDSVPSYGAEYLKPPLEPMSLDSIAAAIRTDAGDGREIQLTSNILQNYIERYKDMTLKQAHDALLTDTNRHAMYKRQRRGLSETGQKELDARYKETTRALNLQTWENELKVYRTIFMGQNQYAQWGKSSEPYLEPRPDIPASPARSFAREAPPIVEHLTPSVTPTQPEFQSGAPSRSGTMPESIMPEAAPMTPHASSTNAPSRTPIAESARAPEITTTVPRRSSDAPTTPDVAVNEPAPVTESLIPNRAPAPAAPLEDSPPAPEVTEKKFTVNARIKPFSSNKNSLSGGMNRDSMRRAYDGNTLRQVESDILKKIDEYERLDQGSEAAKLLRKRIQSAALYLDDRVKSESKTK